MKKIKDNVVLFLKGFIMGVANVIPGVSGGTLAVILGVFKNFLGAISNIFKTFWKSVLFLLPIILGMGVAILASSKVIETCLNKFPLATVLFFVEKTIYLFRVERLSLRIELPVFLIRERY